MPPEVSRHARASPPRARSAPLPPRSGGEGSGVEVYQLALLLMASLPRYPHPRPLPATRFARGRRGGRKGARGAAPEQTTRNRKVRGLKIRRGIATPAGTQAGAAYRNGSDLRSHDRRSRCGREGTAGRCDQASSAAARCILADMSLVTVLCSSTAAAVLVTNSLTLSMAFLIEVRASTTSPEMPLSAAISVEILSVACFA